METLEQTEHPKVKKKREALRGYSLSQISDFNIKTYAFTGEYKAIFGTPGVRSIYLLQGGAKSGKSTFSIRFAQYLTQFGKVGYFSTEEDPKTDITFRQRFEANIVTGEGIVTDKVRCYGTTNIAKIDKTINTGGFRFIFIDSIQACQLTHKAFVAMREKYKRRDHFWILVSQLGPITDYKHLVTAIMEVNKGKLTVASRNVKATKGAAFTGGEQTLFSGLTQ